MKLLIIGGQSTALDIYEVAQRHYYNQFKQIFLVVGDEESFHSSHQFLRDKELMQIVNKHEYSYIISFSNHNLRNKLANFLDNMGFQPTTIIHPSSVISSSSHLGIGCFVAANVVITQKVYIGKHCLINYQSSIGHDTILGNNVIVNPAACISGNVLIGDDTLIGANSFIFQGVKVGNHCLIDAMSYVDKNINDGMLCKNRNLEIIQRKSFQNPLK
jgi:sugar O-acyltransferase (sialic acid O-acetyltransferase NeuD family)